MNASESFAGKSVEVARRALTARFRDHAIDSPELDARLLIGEALGLDLTGLIRAAARRVTSDEAARIFAMAQRRLSGEPIARILGRKEFWGLSLRLSPATLIPRPDTETVVELALEILRAAPDPDRPLRIADIGTGSGAILLALLSEFSTATGEGTDISDEALQTAERNAVDLGLASRTRFIACDYTTGLFGPFDLIVSNPPYIRSAEIEGLAIEVRDHDPHLALDGGADGLTAYRTLIPQAAQLLTPGGILILEAGHDQGGDIQGLMAAAGLALDRPPKADLSGIRRALAGRKTPL